MKYFFENNNNVVENGILKYIDLNTLVIIPNGTKKILGVKEETDLNEEKYGKDIFYTCLNHNEVLKRVVLPEKSVKKIGEKAFEHCHMLSEINFPEGLEEIGINAFLACYKLNSVDLPKTIKILDEWCFSLIDGLIINYNGTLGDWNKIRIAPHWAKKGTLINTLDGEIVI